MTDRKVSKMCKRTHCDRCDALVYEVVDHVPTKGYGILLSVRLCEGDAGPRLDLCAKCARDFLPLLPEAVQATWMASIARNEAMSK
jgi:hypothetical protein